jgi:hypothetical protein
MHICNKWSVLVVGFVAMSMALPVSADRLGPRLHQEESSVQKESMLKFLGGKSGEIPRLVLPEPRSSAAARQENPGPHQVGVPIDLPKSKLRELGVDYPDWKHMSDGRRVATLGIESPDARALRLGIRVLALPDEARLRFGGGSDSGIIEISGSQINGLVAANLSAQPDDPDATLYWSPVIKGDFAIVEVELPAKTKLDGTVIVIEQVSHIYDDASVLPDRVAPAGVGDASYCHNDISCYSYDIDLMDLMKSTARMSFVENGYSYTCTGVLLNDKNPSVDYYFLTANHCISTQSVASSLQTTWFFRSAYCNAWAQGPDVVTRYGGATLIKTLGGNYDTTLLRLNETPPPGVVLAGWDTNIPVYGSALVGVHHPRGDLQKVSFGTRGYRKACQENGDYYNCGADSNGHFLEVNWFDGITELGSSGSGLFIDKQYLIGNLSSGTSSCWGFNNYDNYALFSDAYLAGGFATWLNQEGGVVTPTEPEGSAKNLSTRGHVTTQYPMHGGIVVAGTVKVLVTARGPSTGLSTALEDTVIELYRISSGQLPELIAENDDWAYNANADEIGQETSNRPLEALEAALLLELTAGSYTAMTRGYGGSSGEAVIGFTLVSGDGYIASGSARNLSTRGHVSAQYPMHGGIVVAGTVKVLVTARGPSTGLPTALEDTVIELYRISSGQPPELVAENDDWAYNANADEIGQETSNRPLESREAALLLELTAGSYTAMTRGYGGGSGEAVIGFTVIK